MPEPCSTCDFIGPFVYGEQAPRDLHRALHDLTRTWDHGVAQVVEAFRKLSEAAQNASKANYALAPPEDTTTEKEDGTP